MIVSLVRVICSAKGIYVKYASIKGTYIVSIYTKRAYIEIAYIRDTCTNNIYVKGIYT